MEWNLVTDKQPIAYKTGKWDGKKSDTVICLMKDGSYELCITYEYEDNNLVWWYCQNDYELDSEVVMWAYVPDPFAAGT